MHASGRREAGMTSRPIAHDPYGSLRIANFRRLLMGAMLATVASEMQNVALGWTIYERTSSPLALGLVGLVVVVPVVLLALPAGHMADRFSRKRILVSAQAGLAFASSVLALAGWLHWPMWTLYAGLFLTGAALGIALPARTALLPLLVPVELFSNAVTWRTSGWQLATVAGPALGGFGIALARGSTPVFVASAIVHVLVLVILSGVRPRAASVNRERMTWSGLFAGIQFVRRSELLLAAITLDMVAVLLGGATFLLPIFAKDILNVGPTGLGWLRAAPSMGATLMALVIAHRRPTRTAGRTLLLSVAGFGLATIVFGLSRHLSLSFLMLLLVGAFDNISVVIRGTLLQMMTPDEMRGRVSAVNSVFVNLSNELGGFESGLTAAWWGPVRSVVVGGVGCLCVVWFAIWRWPALARLREIPSVQREGASP